MKEIFLLFIILSTFRGLAVGQVKNESTKKENEVPTKEEIENEVDKAFSNLKKSFIF